MQFHDDRWHFFLFRESPPSPFPDRSSNNVKQQIVLAGAGNDIFGYVYATGVEFSFTLSTNLLPQCNAFVGPVHVVGWEKSKHHVALFDLTGWF